MEHRSVTPISLVSVKQYAALSGYSEKDVVRKIAKKQLDAVAIKGVGRNGINYHIPVKELPRGARVMLALQQRENAGEADLTSYRERFGEAGLERLLAIRDGVVELGLLRGTDEVIPRRAAIAQALGVQPRRVYEWERMYEKEGLKGIMARTERSDKGKSRVLCPLALDRINYMYLSPGKVSQNRVHQSLLKLKEGLGAEVCRECCHNPHSPLRAEMMARGEDPGEVCRMCGEGLVVPDNRHAVNRYIQGIDPAVVTLGRYGKKAFDDLYTPVCRREKPTEINDVWFGDHHIFDVFVLDSQGTPRRPWLTAWMDACSGRITGWIISLQPNANTIMESLVRGIAEKPGSDIWGAPRWIYIDNGKDYRSRKVEGDGKLDYRPGELNFRLHEENALLKTLGIGYHHAIPYRARSKPIERLFRTIEGMEEIRNLPGYCGNKIDAKPEDYMETVRKRQLLTLEEFVGLWVNRIIPMWDHYHDNDEQKESPAELYARCPRARTERFSWGLLSLAMTEKAERKIRPDGLRIDNVRYWHNAMAEHVGARVVVRYFDKARELVSIFLNGRFLCTAGVAENMKMLGEDPEKIAALTAMQAHVRKTKLAVLQLPKKRVQLLDDMAVEMPDLTAMSTITGMVHEQAYRDRKATEQRESQKAERNRKVSDAIRQQQEAAGRALLAMPDVG